MVHHWREKEQEKFTAEAEKTAETVKEAVERTDRIREERAASNSDLPAMTGVRLSSHLLPCHLLFTCSFVHVRCTTVR